MAEFQLACRLDEIPDPGKTVVEIDERMVALFHVEGAVYALDDVCTHDGGPLAAGTLCNHAIACPRHGAQFDIRTGKALTMPATKGTTCHETKIENGQVWIRVRT